MIYFYIYDIGICTWIDSSCDVERFIKGFGVSSSSSSLYCIESEVVINYRTTNRIYFNGIKSNGILYI